MSTCHNCGHAGTFVLLVQFAVAVRDGPPGSDPAVRGRSNPCDRPNRRGRPDCPDRSDRPDRPDAGPADLSDPSDCSLSVQCPACDSTDVGVTAADLLARHGSSTTS